MITGEVMVVCHRRHREWPKGSGPGFRIHDHNCTKTCACELSDCSDCPAYQTNLEAWQKKKKEAKKQKAQAKAPKKQQQKQDGAKEKQQKRKETLDKQLALLRQNVSNSNAATIRECVVACLLTRPRTLFALVTKHHCLVCKHAHQVTISLSPRISHHPMLRSILQMTHRLQKPKARFLQQT